MRIDCNCPHSASLQTATILYEESRAGFKHYLKKYKCHSLDIYTVIIQGTRRTDCWTNNCWSMDKLENWYEFEMTSCDLEWSANVCVLEE